MLRRHLLAAVLTVAATVCIASFWWEIWLAVAYERHSHYPTRSLVPFACYEKRASWLPGKDIVLPNQVCGVCYGADHPDVFREFVEENREAIATEFAKSGGDPEELLSWIPTHESCLDRLGRRWIDYEDGFRFLLNTDIWECTCPTCYPERDK